MRGIRHTRPLCLADCLTMTGIDRLLAIMRRLRDPQSGYPWDLDQTFASIVPFTLEEAFEVAEAVERNDPSASTRR